MNVDFSKRYGFLLIMIVILAAAAVFSSCIGSQEAGKGGTPVAQEQAGEETTGEGLEQSEAGPDQQAEEPGAICPIDGQKIGGMPVRPIAVTIDNYRAARPQSGLDKADLVYEIPVEGGITRYLAIYFHGETAKVGPIRSARPYLIDIAREWGAVYIHIGQSPQAQVYFSRTKVAHINQMYHSSGFWRDKSRKAPHNLYSSTADLRVEMEALGWNVPTPVESFSFVEDGGAATGAAASGITINYYYGAVSYRYDSASGLYLRYLDGAPYRDLEAGGQLSASNVLIQRVPLRSFDAEGRLEIDLTGEGEMLFFSGGIVESGSWKKDSVTSRTKYYNGSGAEISFRQGQTWIQMVSKDTQVSYE